MAETQTTRPVTRVRKATDKASRVTALVVLPLAVALLALLCGHALGLSALRATLLGMVFLIATAKTAWDVFFRRPSAHERGQQRSSFEAARRCVEAEWGNQDSRMGQRIGGLSWAGLSLVPSAATKNFAFVGQIGSGKSTQITLLMRSALDTVGEGMDHRALIYDAAGTAYEQLRNIPKECPECARTYELGRSVRCSHCNAAVTTVHNLDPFDVDCCPLDLARDITSPAAAGTLAHILIEDRPGSNEFFTKATRVLLASVVEALQLMSPGKWVFSDVCRIMRDKECLKSVLGQSERTAHVIRNLTVEETFDNVMATVLTYLWPYEIIAALWDRSSKPSISLRDWIRDDVGSILILSRNQEAPEAGDALNRLILTRLNQLLQSQKPSNSRRTWFFLDEIAQTKLYSYLTNTATNARKYGGCLVIGIQDIEQFRAVYGREEANTILGQCAFKALLRSDSPENQKWASSVVGHEELVDPTTSETDDGHVSTSYRKQEKSLVMPSEFATLPPADFTRGVAGWYVSPVTGPFGYPEAVIPGARLRAEIKPPLEGTDSLELDERAQYMRVEWNDDDAKRLCNLKLPLSISVPKEEPANFKQIEVQPVTLPRVRATSTPLHQ